MGSVQGMTVYVSSWSVGSANLPAAAVFYLLYPVGLVVFAIAPALKSGSVVTALVYGALFGAFTYGTYDLSNQATLRNWTTTLTLIDVAWGTLLAATSSVGQGAGQGGGRGFGGGVGPGGGIPPGGGAGSGLGGVRDGVSSIALPFADLARSEPVVIAVAVGQSLLFVALLVSWIVVAFGPTLSARRRPAASSRSSRSACRWTR